LPAAEETRGVLANKSMQLLVYNELLVKIHTGNQECQLDGDWILQNVLIIPKVAIRTRFAELKALERNYNHSCLPIPPQPGFSGDKSLRPSNGASAYVKAHY
jgi:hypothetical protein